MNEWPRNWAELTRGIGCEMCENGRVGAGIGGSERSGRVTGGKRRESPGVLPLRGGSFAASFGRGPYVRGGCRARHPRHRP